jgi:hypothetical protein
VLLVIVSFIILNAETIGKMGFNLTFNGLTNDFYSNMSKSNPVLLIFVAIIHFMLALGLILLLLLTVPRWIADYFAKPNYVSFNSKASANVRR